MSTDDLEQKPSSTGGLKKLSKLGGTQPKPVTQNLVEQVPPWLQRLLTKYHETSGRLVGLGEGVAEAEEAPPVVRSGATGALNNLLEQMAEEGIPESPHSQRATSVEWGSYDEPEEPPLDDFLSSLGSTPAPYQAASPAYPPPVEAPDWLNEVIPAAAPDYDQPLDSAIENEAPDWLTEMIPPSVERSAPSPPTQFDEAPDWLTEALEIPASRPSASPPPPVSPAPPTRSSGAVDDVPDWLTAALESPTEASSPSPGPSPADFDVPDWLAEPSDEPALPTAFPPAPSEGGETPYAVDVPDWLQNIIVPPGEEEPAYEESEPAADMPDWLADIPRPHPAEESPAPSIPSTPPSWETPDWITGAEIAEEKPGVTVPDTSNWLAQGNDLPSLDWLFQEQPSSPAEAEIETPAQEDTGWLFDSAAIPSFEPPQAAPPQTGRAAPSWLDDLPAQEEESAIPDWLQNMSVETDVPAASFDQPPAWLQSLENETGETGPTAAAPGQTDMEWPAESEAAIPPWLAQSDAPPAPPSQPAPPAKSLKPLKRLSPQPQKPAESQPSPSLPDWAAGLVPANVETGPTSPPLPDWAARLVPPETPVSGTTILALPDWAKELVPPGTGAETPPPPDLPQTPAPRPLSRLGSLSKPAPETPQPIPPAETPDWLKDLPSEKPEALPWLAEDQPAAKAAEWLGDSGLTETGEAGHWPAEVDQPAAESADWLSDLSAKAGEVPDWLADLSGPTQEAGSTADDWLSAETPVEDDNLLAERLDWFTQGHSEETSTSAPPPAAPSSADLEIPDWLAEAASAPPPAVPASPVQLPVEAEREELDWLADLPFPEVREEPAAPSEAVGTMADMEIPPWLADLSAATPGEVTPSRVEEEAEEDILPWLGELPDISVTEQGSQAEAVPGLEIPSRLTELPKPSAPMSSEPAEAEMERPPWLTDLPGEELESEEFETPSWMTELPEASPVTSMSPQAEFEAESEPDEGLETPDWLMGLLESAEPEAAPVQPGESREPESQPETAPWLAEWPTASTGEAPASSISENIQEEVEMPSWLSGLPELPETTPPAPTWGEESAEESELEAPPWLAGLSAEGSEAAVAEETEAEESPPWLAELPPLTAAETAMQGSEAEFELPSWLSELPATSESEAVAAGTESETLELPPWLTSTEGVTQPEVADLAEVETGEEIPSWLAELSETPPFSAVSAGPAETEVEAESESPSWLSELPETPAESETEVPSWLSSLREAPAAEEQTEPDIETERPSWLLTDVQEETALEQMPPAIEGEVEAEAELDLPSWLTQLPAPSIGTGEAETSSETPPWLADLSEAPTPEEIPGRVTPEVEVEPTPAWLSDLGQASPTAVVEEAAETELEMPSWLSELPEVPTSETAGEAVAQIPESEAELEVPSWLGELPQVPEAGQVPTEPVEAEEELEIPPWLTSVAGVTGGVAAAVVADESAAEAEQEAPSWLADLQEVPEIETGAEAETPAWLADLDQGITAEAVAAEATAETEQEMPSWLSELPEAPIGETSGEAVAQVPESEAELEIPSWLSELPEMPSIETGLVPVVEEGEAEVETPPWLAELAAMQEGETAPADLAQAAESEAEPEIPAWLADLGETPTLEEMPSRVTPEAEIEATPSWLMDLGEVEGATTEAVAETELEIPAWLQEIPEAPTSVAASTEAPETEAEEEIPAWLSELPQAPEAEQVPTEPVEAEEELEIPPWLTGVAGVTGGVAVAVVADESAAEAEQEAPSWLADLSQEVTSEAVAAEATAETELEIPSWLSELPETPTIETAGEAVTQIPESEAELEIPAWLSELPQAPETEEPSAAPIEGEAEEPLEIPAWLTGITAMGAVEAAETEMPSWLAELPTASEAESAPEVLTEETEAETDLEMPAWLKELPPAPTIPEPGEEPESEELEIPSWLTGVMGAAAAAGTGVAPEAEAEIPAGPAELPSFPETAGVAEEAEAETELVIPSWLSQLPPAPTLPTKAAELESGAVEAELEEPAWQSETAEPETPPTPAVPVGEAEGEAEAEELPPWLADLSTEDLKLPSWLSDVPEFAATPVVPVETSEGEVEVEPLPAQMEQPLEIGVAETPAAPPPAEEMAETELPPKSDWLSGLDAATAAVKAALPAEKTDDLFFTSEEEPELPAWLMETPEPAGAKTEAPVVGVAVTGEVEGEPESPDWLKDLSEPTAPPVAGTAAAEAILPPAETKASPTERMTDWLRQLGPTEEALADEDDKVAESTGVLAGLGPLLPVEKIAAPTPMLAPQATASTAQADAMLEAAQHFYAIATQAPQPATLPEPLTGRNRLLGNIVRGILYLVFIILLALPLVPGLQKVADRTTGQKVPWTEPAGSLNAILDKQRRELVSVQLGAIDLQQPGAVALVSFDYSTATQGEMQPLAEAIIGRLRGQGMRLIFISLEPEGATLAQRLLDQTLAERGESYGTEAVNLGYVPGQMAGIRELVNGRKQLSLLPDFKEGLTFAAPARAAWNGINNLGQVDVLITLSDNPVTARWWIEQMAAAVPPDDGERYLLAATSATADPFLRPYLDSHQLDGLISGINGAAAIEAGRKNFGPARQMVDSQGIAHLLIVILIALGTMAGWMPPVEKKKSKAKAEAKAEVESHIVES